MRSGLDQASGQESGQGSVPASRWRERGMGLPGECLVPSSKESTANDISVNNIGASVDWVVAIATLPGRSARQENPARVPGESTRQE